VDRDELLRALSAFEKEGLEYVLIGATAMGFHSGLSTAGMPPCCAIGSI
jgi:hypothetical protein